MASRISAARADFLALRDELNKGLAAKVQIDDADARAKLDAMRAEVDAIGGAIGKLSLGGSPIATGGGPAFSTASHGDFAKSKWDTSGGGQAGGVTSGGNWADTFEALKGWKKRAEEAEKKDREAGGGKNAPKDLKYLLKQAGIGKAAQAAIAVAGGLELTKLALGYRGMAQLQALTVRASMQGRQLFRGVDSSPIVRATDRFFQLVNASTPAGKALSSMLSGGFNAFFKAIETVEPYVSAFLKGMIIGGMRVQESWYDLQLAILPITDALAGIDVGPVDGIALAADAGAASFRVLAGIIDTTAAGIRTLIDAYNALDKRVRRNAMTEADQILLGNQERDAAARKAREDAESSKTTEVFDITGGQKPKLISRGGVPVEDAEASGVNTGAAYGQGLAKGMRGSIPAVTAAGQELGAAGDKGVRTGADAHSPSRKTEKTGRDLGAGVVVGMQGSAGEVQAAAAQSLVPKLPGGAGAGGQAAGPARAIELHVHHHWPAGVEGVKRGAIEDAGETGTARALRAWAAELAIPLEAA